MEIEKIFEGIEEGLAKVFGKLEEKIDPIVEQPVRWFVKYRTIRGIVEYLPCEGIEMAREYAKRLNGQIMNVKI